MTTPEERLATLEAEMKDVRDDVHDIKNSLQNIERIAARGSGALTTVLMIGGFLGWLGMAALGLLNFLKHP